MYLKELYINENAWMDINKHAIEGDSIEIGGFLMGFKCILDDHPIVWITKSVRGNCRSSAAQVIIETSTYDNVLTEMESNGLSVVGWYHTHPGIGIFLSGTDKNTMFRHFNNPSSIALVLDPKRNTWGFFGWDEEKRRLKHLSAHLFCGDNCEEYLQES
ncbi:MAG TPA: Mov34/MPN/PAD-1 family protein [Methanothrix sp.]|nr:Mov34/MPN/PAD-1 family protein [Methanothrix sp.]